MSSLRTTPAPRKVGSKTAVLRGMGKRSNAERGTPDDRVEHEGLAARLDHVVEEGAELRARERRALLGHPLHDVLELALGHQRARDPVQPPGRAVLRAQARLRHGGLALVAQAGDGAAQPGGDELQGHAVLRRRRSAGLEAQLEHAHRAEAFLHLELDPILRRGPRGVAGGGAEPLAGLQRQHGGAHAELLADPRQHVRDDLTGRQRVDGRIQCRPKPREQTLGATALRADRRFPLHRASVPVRASLHQQPGRHEVCVRPLTVVESGGTCVFPC